MAVLYNHRYLTTSVENSDERAGSSDEGQDRGEISEATPMRGGVTEIRQTYSLYTVADTYGIVYGPTLDLGA